MNLNNNILANRKEKSNMSQSIAVQKSRDKILEQVVTKGDLSDLTSEQKISYYNAVCVSLGLNPLTKPFEFLSLEDKKSGKTRVVLYARKDATEQLRKINGVSIWKVEQKLDSDCWIVTAHAKTADGREDIDEGVVYIKGLLGESRSNAIMKAITKAKRRVTLSICGLGFLDESEIDSIPNAQLLASPEQEAIMTEGEGVNEGTWHAWLPNKIESRKDLTEEQARAGIKVFQDRLTVIKQAEITKWNCSSESAIKLMDVYGQLIARGVDKTTIQQRLPNNSPSFRALSEAQAQEALKTFTHWLKTYNEVVQEEVVNNG